MSEEKKTAAELIALLRERFSGLPFCTIHGDPLQGWYAQVVAAPNDVVAWQAAIDPAVQELRALYDLKS